jgi:hypothetical protein
LLLSEDDQDNNNKNATDMQYWREVKIDDPSFFGHFASAADKSADAHVVSTVPLTGSLVLVGTTVAYNQIEVCH